MRLPWQQLSMDGKRRAKAFGLLLGIGSHAGVGFVSDLWEAALDLSPDGDFTGAFTDPVVLIAHSGGNPLGCRAEPARVVEVLQMVGLVATVPTMRVRGLDRYRGAWLKNRGHRTTRAGSAAEPDANPKRKTETETENLKALSTSSSGKAKKQKPKPQKESPPDPRHSPLREKLMEAFKRRRGAELPWAGRQGKTLQRLLDQRAREDLLWPVSLLAAFERALLATHPDLKSLEDFERDLLRYIGTGPPDPKVRENPNGGIIEREIHDCARCGGGASAAVGTPKFFFCYPCMPLAEAELFVLNSEEPWTVDLTQWVAAQRQERGLLL